MNPWIDRFKEQLLAPATPVFYYNADTHDFLFLQDTGTRSGLTDWVPLRPKEAAMALGHRGYKLSPSEGEQMSQVETMLHECRMDPTGRSTTRATLRDGRRDCIKCAGSTSW